MMEFVVTAQNKLLSLIMFSGRWIRKVLIVNFAPKKKIPTFLLHVAIRPLPRNFEPLRIQMSKYWMILLSKMAMLPIKTRCCQNTYLAHFIKF